MDADKFLMADSLINEEKKLADGMSMDQCLRIFGCSRSGYYAWVARRRDKNGKQAQKAESDRQLMEKFRQIIATLGYVPGKRIFRTHMWRDHDIHVSVKQCKRIMEKMNLTAKRPKKDPYKHQATHDHICASPENKVNQEFYVGPRKIILTDITYLFYGKGRTPIYLCAFKDAYTREVLGYALSMRMNVELVKHAYDRMMKNHGNELTEAECIIHSDQGSQYLSTTFKKILSDDGFIQSVSGRGNSQDNAPMESFFGRMKTEIMDLIALCPDANTVTRMVDGYMHAYNHVRYQYSLAGLAPAEYYTFVTTGIYPLDNYFGIKASELLSVTDLVKKRLELAAEKSEKVRLAEKKKRDMKSGIGKAAELIVRRDQRLLIREIAKWAEAETTASNQVVFLRKIFEKTKKVIDFLNTLNRETLEELRQPQNWQKYKELDYIYDMKGLF